MKLKKHELKEFLDEKVELYNQPLSLNLIRLVFHINTRKNKI